MIMPIVSMNKMAMNESVATTCCYRQIASNSTALYWDVLHGGWIGNGYGVSTDDWKAAYKPYKDTAWLSKSFGRDLGGEQADIVALFAGNTLNYGSAGGTETARWYINTFVPGQSFETALYGASAGKVTYGSACEHNVPTCKYRDYGYGYLTNKHFEATSAHAGVTEWAKPHDPKQYLS